MINDMLIDYDDGDKGFEYKRDDGDVGGDCG